MSSLENKMFDIHSHTLWGIDDGSRDLETTVELCDMAVESGTGTLFLTPHLLYWETSEKLYDKRESLKQRQIKKDIDRELKNKN